MSWQECVAEQSHSPHVQEAKKEKYSIYLLICTAGIELRALHMLGKLSTTKLHPQQEPKRKRSEALSSNPSTKKRKGRMRLRSKSPSKDVS
jgi:hypothetical protein